MTLLGCLIFSTIAQEGTFARAAEQLHLHGIAGGVDCAAVPQHLGKGHPGGDLSLWDVGNLAVCAVVLY